MSLIDFILNIAGLLLWVSWRYVPFDPLTKTRPATLTGTLRPAESANFRFVKSFARTGSLLAIVPLLLFRAFFYWWIGPALSWTPAIKLGAIAISFRSDLLERMMLFSLGSFMHILVVFYLWLLLFSLLHPRPLDSDPAGKFLRIQLGAVHVWPWFLKLLLPLVAAFVIWLGPGCLLNVWGIVPAAPSWLQRAEQGLVLGLGTYLVWKYALGAVLGLHLLNTYVYLGNHPIWNFINSIARRVLTPLRAVPLRIGKVDFAPVVGIALIFLLAELLENGLHKKLPVGNFPIDIPGLVDIYRKISN